VIATEQVRWMRMPLLEVVNLLALANS